MALVLGAAQRVLDDHNTKAEINGAEHSGEHADVRLGAGDHEILYSLLCQQSVVEKNAAIGPACVRRGRIPLRAKWL